MKRAKIWVCVAVMGMFLIAGCGAGDPEPSVRLTSDSLKDILKDQLDLVKKECEQGSVQEGTLGGLNAAAMYLKGAMSSNNVGTEEQWQKLESSSQGIVAILTDARENDRAIDVNAVKQEVAALEELLKDIP